MDGAMVMSRRGVTVVRWFCAGLYALLGAVLTGGGMTGGEFAFMAVLGAIALVYVVLMDWIVGTGKAGGEDVS